MALEDRASQIEQALADYRKAGLRVMPLCSPKGGHNHGGKPCTHPGKVPLQKDWQKQAGQAMDDRLLAALAKHKGNLGLPIPPGLVAMDADSLEDFNRLGSLLKSLRLTFWCQRTGRGGHFILRSPASGDVRNSVKRNCEGVTYDVRGIGGQIVVFPSIHANGSPYIWAIGPVDVPIEKLSVLPEKFISEQEPASLPVSEMPLDAEGGPVTEGQRNDALFRLGCSLRAKGEAEPMIWAALQKHNAAHCSPPLAEDEVKGIAASAARYVPGLGGDKPRDIDAKAEMAAFREKWPAAAEEKDRDKLLNDVIAALMHCSVLERERALDEIRSLTGLSKQVLNKVMAEQARRMEAEVREQKKRRRQAMVRKEGQLARVDYNVVTDPVNRLYDALVGVMRPTDRFYNQHNNLVYVRPGHGLIPLTEKNLPGFLSSITEIALTDMGADGPEFKGFKVLKAELAAAFIHSPRVASKFRLLNQYSRSPVFDTNWNPIFTPGYHAASGIYYDGPTVAPAEGTSCLLNVLRGFLWKSATDMVNYIGMLLTGITMPHWPGKHPMAAYNGNKPGVGKSTGARINGIILEGHTPVTLSFNPNDEEFEKHLATRIGVGDRVVTIDNAKKTGHVREVESPTLERSITDPVLNYRRLGSNQAICRPNDVIFNLTMNYTKMSPDLRRRSIPINFHVDKNVRDVRYPIENLDGYVEEHRLELLAELAGMVVRRLKMGKLEIEKPARHSVSQAWAESIDGILRCSDLNGFLDNFDESEHAFDTDYQLLVEICAAHKDQSPLTASEWAALLVDNILEARLKERGGKAKPLRSQATIVGNLFNGYLDTPIELEEGKCLLACEEHGRGHPNTYYFKPVDEAREAGC